MSSTTTKGVFIRCNICKELFRIGKNHKCVEVNKMKYNEKAVDAALYLLSDGICPSGIGLKDFTGSEDCTPEKCTACWEKALQDEPEVEVDGRE